MTDIGLEAHYKRDFLVLEADYFHKRTKDILARPALQAPSVLGASLPDFNNAIVDNSGWEIQLEHNNHIGKLGIHIGVNVSFNSNKIVSYPESQSTPAWQKITGTSVANLFSGYPFLGYLSQGLYQTAQEVSSGPTPLFSTVAPGDIRYKDLDKDGAITANDQTIIGKHLFPAIQYGVNFGVHYAGWECNVLLQGSGNVQGYNSAISYGSLVAGVQELNHWTPQNTSAPFPRLWVNYQNNYQSSDYWMENSAYIRLKNIELAYTLPLRLLQRSGMKSIRLALSGNNLLTFSHLKYYDPEGFNGQINSYYVTNPLMKSFTAGATLQF